MATETCKWSETIFLKFTSVQSLHKDSATPKGQTVEEERLFGLKTCNDRVYQTVMEEISMVPTDNFILSRTFSESHIMMT